MEIFEFYDWFDQDATHHRTPQEYPYSYDSFFVWGGAKVRYNHQHNVKMFDAWADRIRRQHPQAYEKGCKKVSNAVYMFDEAQALTWLQEVFPSDDIQECIGMLRSCNCQTGEHLAKLYWK